MTGGVPSIVSSTVGCHPDLIVEGKTGFVFKNGNVNDLSKKIDLMVELLCSKKETKREVLNHIKKYSLTETVRAYHKAIEKITRY